MLLSGVAQRINLAIRDTDTVSREEKAFSPSIARLGGDEFTVLLSEIYDNDDARNVAQRILDLLKEPFEIEDHEVTVSASIGIAIYPRDGRDIETIIKSADIAMYHAKENGKNTYQFHSESMTTSALRYLSIESQLRKALEREEFALYYQPQVDIRNSSLIGVEALIRWEKNDGTVIAPGDFMPIAEETGLIIPIGEWVMHKACQQNKMWQDEGYRPITVAVNLSGVQFKDRTLLKLIKNSLDATGLSPRFLELELVENTIMLDTAKANRLFAALKEMSVSLAIDDFGTGYSSLSHLKKFPIDRLKIDRSFVHKVDRDKDNASIVIATITMGHSLGMEVIAEGVETDRELAFLRDNDCDVIQGYLISRPLPEHEMQEILVLGKLGDYFNEINAKK